MQTLDSASDRRYWRKAFKQLVEQYLETKSIACTTPLIFGYGTIGSPRQAPACSRMVHTSMSDFICDVEIALRTNMDVEETYWFDTIYRYQTPGFSISPEVQEKFELKLGKVFCERGLYPITAYFKPVYVEGIAQ